MCVVEKRVCYLTCSFAGEGAGCVWLHQLPAEDEGKRGRDCISGRVSLMYYQCCDNTRKGNHTIICHGR